MIISEMFNGFRICFDDKFSITISEEEAKRILEYLKQKEAAGLLQKNKSVDPNVYKFFDCGEY